MRFRGINRRDQRRASPWAAPPQRPCTTVAFNSDHPIPIGPASATRSLASWPYPFSPCPLNSPLQAYGRSFW